MTQAFEANLAKLRPTLADEQTEHTSRAALENLPNAFAAEGINIRVQHEPGRVEGKGAPDFRIDQNAMILGYVEVKALGGSFPRFGLLKSDKLVELMSKIPAEFQEKLGLKPGLVLAQ